MKAETIIATVVVTCEPVVFKARNAITTFSNEVKNEIDRFREKKFTDEVDKATEYGVARGTIASIIRQYRQNYISITEAVDELRKYRKEIVELRKGYAKEPDPSDQPEDPLARVRKNVKDAVDQGYRQHAAAQVKPVPFEFENF